MRSPLSPHLSPNVTLQDIRFVVGALLFPWKWFFWKKGNAQKNLHKRFEDLFHADTALSYDSGRSALTAVIQGLPLSDSAVVAVQAFSCIVVPNSIIAGGAKPLFVDIDETYNMDVEDLEKKLQENPDIEVVVVQHTFGIAADMEKIVALCKKYNVFLVEDCAHALGARYKDQLLGTFGIAAIFSFGRDKVLSTVSGGIAITHDTQMAQKMKAAHLLLNTPNKKWIAKRLFHPVLFWISLHFYYVASIGKACIALGLKMGIIPLVLDKKEKNGISPAPFQFPNILAQWALLQMDHLDDWNRHRRDMAEIYTKKLKDVKEIELPKQHTSILSDPIFFRYTIEVPDNMAVLKSAKKSGILLGDWYTTVLAPKDCSPSSVGYKDGSCIRAEKALSHVVNLPTHQGISKKDAAYIADSIIQEMN